ncbi:Spherulation-specific family 4 [Mycena belliarum]|uniref:Spherulation-specific family 4 n=1 Tax=Mycena belliarum TaxID=1033014 RepID=A0AAD6U568_9AGAR|nr:Spherulation-specific family 4 [Mycena belliae]
MNLYLANLSQTMFAFLFILALVLRPALALLSKGVIFPLYIYPGDECAAWAPVFTAATANPTLPFLVIANPDSGPGAVANTQPDSNYQTCLTNLTAHANVRSIGYVATGYGTRASAAVEADIATYAQWSAAYRPSGIFFDETEATPAFEALYRSYAAAVHSSTLGSSAFVAFNPGVVPDAAFYGFADLIVSAEDFYQDFSTSDLTINATAPAAKQAVILHAGPSATPVDLVRQLTGQLGIRYIFITDAEYTSIPKDWLNFCANVAAAQ